MLSFLIIIKKFVLIWGRIHLSYQLYKQIMIWEARYMYPTKQLCLVGHTCPTQTNMWFVYLGSDTFILPRKTILVRQIDTIYSPHYLLSCIDSYWFSVYSGAMRLHCWTLFKVDNSTCKTHQKYLAHLPYIFCKTIYNARDMYIDNPKFLLRFDLDVELRFPVLTPPISPKNHFVKVIGGVGVTRFWTHIIWGVRGCLTMNSNRKTLSDSRLFVSEQIYHGSRLGTPPGGTPVYFRLIVEVLLIYCWLLSYCRFIFYCRVIFWFIIIFCELFRRFLSYIESRKHHK